MRRLWPLLSVLLLGACSSSGPIHKPAELQPLEAQLSVLTQWSAATPASKLDAVYDRLAPVVSDDIIYTIGAKGVVYALDTVKGKKLWSRELDTVVSAGLGHNDEFLFVGTSDGEVIALSRADGEIQWRASVATEVLAAPAANANYVIARCGNGQVYALNSQNGIVLWQLKRNVPALTLRGNSTAVIAGEIVLLGTAEGRLLAASIYNGDVLWEATVAAPQGRTDLERMVDVDATPIVVGNVVYTAAYQGRVMALSLDSGRILWSRDIGSAVGMTLDEKNLYLVADDSHVWALDRGNGATLWKQDGLEYRDLSTPAIFENALVVGDFEGYLHWLSLEDGSMLARHLVSEEESISTALQVKGDVAYIRNSHGKIEALKLKGM